MCIRPTLLLFFAFLLGCSANAAPLDAAEAKRDAAILVAAMRTLHPALDKYRSPAEAEAAFARFELRAQAARSTGEMYLAATELAASVRCGHTWTNVLNQQGAIKQELLEAPNKLPLTLTLVAGRWLVLGSAAAGIDAGDELLAIDGHTTAQVVAIMLPYLRADGSSDGKRLRQLSHDRPDYSMMDIVWPLLVPPFEGAYTLLVRRGEAPARAMKVSTVSLAERKASLEAKCTSPVVLAKAGPHNTCDQRCHNTEHACHGSPPSRGRRGGGDAENAAGSPPAGRDAWTLDVDGKLGLQTTCTSPVVLAKAEAHTSDVVLAKAGTHNTCDQRHHNTEHACHGSPPSRGRRGGGDAWSLDIDGKRAVMTLPTFSVYRNKFDWQAFFASSFAELKRNKTEHLIIDIRDNEGGDGAIALALLGWIAKHPLSHVSDQSVTMYERVPYKLARYLDTWDFGFFDRTGMVDKITEGPQAGRLRFRPNAAKVHQVIPQPDHFSGTVWVLVGPENSSAAFSLARLVKESKVATLVGQPTGGNLRGLNGGQLTWVTLPHSGVAVDIPLLATSYLSDTPDASITPDIAVRPSFALRAAGHDADMEAVLRAIRQSRKN